MPFGTGDASPEGLTCRIAVHGTAATSAPRSIQAPNSGTSPPPSLPGPRSLAQSGLLLFFPPLPRAASVTPLPF